MDSGQMLMLPHALDLMESMGHQGTDKLRKVRNG